MSASLRERTAMTVRRAAAALPERTARLAVAALPAVALMVAGCADTASTRDVRATLVDDAGQPVVGAVFYAEVCDDDGAFTFVWAVSGQAGEVPDSAYEPLKIPWRPGAWVSLVALAPGHRVAVLRLESPNPRTDGALLTLVRSDTPWNPDLAGLSYPFEAQPELAAELQSAAPEPLKSAFREAWQARPDSAGPPTELELQKLGKLGLR